MAWNLLLKELVFARPGRMQEVAVALGAADRTGGPQEYTARDVWRWIRGATPRRQTREDLAALFGCTPEELFPTRRRAPF